MIKIKTSIGKNSVYNDDTLRNYTTTKQGEKVVCSSSDTSIVSGEDDNGNVYLKYLFGGDTMWTLTKDGIVLNQEEQTSEEWTNMGECFICSSRLNMEDLILNGPDPDTTILYQYHKPTTSTTIQDIKDGMFFTQPISPSEEGLIYILTSTLPYTTIETLGTYEYGETYNDKVVIINNTSEDDEDSSDLYINQIEINGDLITDNQIDLEECSTLGGSIVIPPSKQITVYFDKSDESSDDSTVNVIFKTETYSDKIIYQRIVEDEEDVEDTYPLIYNNIYMTSGYILQVNNYSGSTTSWDVYYQNGIQRDLDNCEPQSVTHYNVTKNGTTLVWKVIN